MIAYALLFAAQAAAPQPPLYNEPAAWSDQERQLRAAGVIGEEITPEARATMASFAGCVIEISPDKVDEVLMRDFRTSQYRNGLRNLSRANEGCARKVGLRGSMRSTHLPFAAALAEAMLERDAAPLNARLARAAAGPAVETYAAGDALAMCVARSVPDDVAALFASEPGSGAEAEALAKVEPVAAMCSKGAKLQISPIGLRSIVATASYRLIASQQS